MAKVSRERSRAVPIVALVAMLVVGGALAAALGAPPPASGGRDLSGAPGTSAPSGTAATSNFAVSFVESGLPNGTWWSAALGGRTKTTPGDSTITFSEPNGTYRYNVTSAGYIATPASGEVTVAGASVSLAVAFANQSALFPVVFRESGLAPGTPWGVALNGSAQRSSNPSITFEARSGTYPYSIDGVPGYTTEYRGTVSVAGAGVSRNVTFAVVQYSLSFVETGLPPGTNWSVTVANATLTSTGSMIQLSVANGTYPYLIGPIGGYSTPSRGSATIRGAADVIAVPFASVLYPIAFTESGLPAGAGWNVELAGATRTATGATIVWEEPNGSYAATVSAGPSYTVDPSSLLVNVSGAGRTFTLEFVPVDFVLTFHETGLLTGDWGVNVNGTLVSGGAGQNLSTSVPNGAYPYRVQPIVGYSTSWSGIAIVAGANQTVAIAFVAVQYSVQFVPTGLASGVAWNVTFAGETHRGTTSSFTFRVGNGTYPFVTQVDNSSWQTLDQTGNVTVAGANLQIAVGFAYAYPVTFNEVGFAPGVVWTVNISGQVSIATVGGAVARPGFSQGVRYSFSTAAPSFAFPLPNGTYTYTVSVPGLAQGAPPPPGGSLSVLGASPPAQTVGPPSPTGASPTLPSAILLTLAAITVVAVAALGAVAYRQVRRRPSSFEGTDALDELYAPYELATEVDLREQPPPSDPLDDIF